MPARGSILLIHGGAGLDQHAREQAARFAALGYLVFGGDMYGKATAGSRDGIMAALNEWRTNRAGLVDRAVARLDRTCRLSRVRWAPVTAIGYCFGGMAVLSMARAGVDLAGIISVHGSLATPAPAAPGAVRRNCSCATARAIRMFRSVTSRTS